jgi:hypothetical protein
MAERSELVSDGSIVASKFSVNQLLCEISLTNERY